MWRLRLTSIVSINPLDLIVGYGSQGGPVLAQFASKDSEKVMGYLDTPEVRKLLPRNLEIHQICMGKTRAKQ